MSRQSREETLAADREWVFEAVPRVSRTFALSIDLLEEPLASWVATGYLLCRTADTIEDDVAIDPRRRAELLESFDAALDPDADESVDDFLAAIEETRPDADGDDWDVVYQVDRTLRVLRSFDPAVGESMLDVASEMATGMADVLRRHADDGGLRLSTVEELEEYCWYVAGTVGVMITELRNYHGPDIEATPDLEDARSFALLLQLVNIAKDVRADWEEENNVYLPGEWLAEEGLDHEDVADPESSTAVAHVVERVVDHAAGHADGARRYLTTLPEDESGLLEAFGLPYVLALGTIRELRGRTVDAVREADAVKLQRREVAALFDRMGQGVTQSDVSDIAATVRNEPYEP